jgi:uncharacterized membrane protein
METVNKQRNTVKFRLRAFGRRLGLFLSPWLFGFSAEAYAAWKTWIVCGFVAIIAAAALWVHMIADIVVAILAAINIWFTHNHRLSAARNNGAGLKLSGPLPLAFAVAMRREGYEGASDV